MSGARVRVLGATRLEVDGVLVPLTTGQRRLLARLAVSLGTPVTREQLVLAMWGTNPPATARASLQNQVSRLRSVCGADLVATTSRGYVLQAPTDAGDLLEAVRDAELLLLSDPSRLEHFQPLDLGDGVPYADLDDAPYVLGARIEAEELISSARDLEVEVALTRGQHSYALARARRLSRESPYDEGRAGRLVRALAALGRRGEALTEVAQFRRNLRTQQGLEIGPMLADLERGLLQVDVDTTTRPGLPPDVGRVLDAVGTAVRAGRSVAVVGQEGAGITAVLAQVRGPLADGRALARASVQRSRDIAVEPLLDLLDDLRLEPDAGLGPMGSFVPALRGLREPVLLVVDDADLAGPSTRRALVEAASLPGVGLVVGIHSHDPLLIDAMDEVVRLDDPPEVDVAVLRRRFHGLAEATRHTLVAAALSGADSPVLSLDVLDASAGLEDAVERGLLVVSNGTMRIPSVAMRQVILAETPSGVQEELHHALGRHLLDHGAPRQAARHLLAAVALEPLVAVRAARVAAASASAEGAHHDAAELLRHALDATGGLVSPADRIALKIELGDALRLAGDPSHLPMLLETVQKADLLGDANLLGAAAYALLQLGALTVSTELLPQVTEVLTLALRRLESGEQRALVLAAASLAYSMTGNSDRCREFFVEAESAARTDVTRRQVLPFAYLGLGRPEDHPVRDRLGRELVVLGRAAGDPVAEFEGHHLLCSARVVAGDGPGVREFLRGMERLVDRAGDVGRRWSLLYVSAAVAHIEDSLDECDRLAEAAYGLMQPVSESRAVAALYGQMFGVAMIRGQLAELAPVLEGLVADQPGVPAWTAAWALCLVESDPARALSLAEEALGAVERDFTWLPAHQIGGRAAALAVEAGARGGERILAEYESRLSAHSGVFSWQGTCSYGPIDTTLALLARACGNAPAADALAGRARRQSEQLQAPAFIRDLGAVGFPGP